MPLSPPTCPQAASATSCIPCVFVFQNPTHHLFWAGGPPWLQSLAQGHMSGWHLWPRAEVPKRHRRKVLRGWAVLKSHGRWKCAAPALVEEIVAAHKVGGDVTLRSSQGCQCQSALLTVARGGFQAACFCANKIPSLYARLQNTLVSLGLQASELCPGTFGPTSFCPSDKPARVREGAVFLRTSWRASLSPESHCDCGPSTRLPQRSWRRKTHLGQAQGSPSCPLPVLSIPHHLTPLRKSTKGRFLHHPCNWIQVFGFSFCLKTGP